MSKTSDTVLARRRRHARVRARVQGTPERPRLCVFRSLRHIYVQVIDDTQGRTLLAVSTLDPEVQTEASAVSAASAAAASAASAAAARSEAGHGKKAQTKSSAATKGSPERSESGSASGAGGASATEGSPERSESRSASGAGGASAERAERANGKAKTQQAVAVGQVLARRALAAGIKSVVFDRGGYMYHGRVKALAEAARKGGLDF
jgi:ribosomal protein L18